MQHRCAILKVAAAASFLIFSHTVSAGFEDFLQTLKKDVSTAVGSITKKPGDDAQAPPQTIEPSSTIPQSTSGSGLTRQENRELQQLLVNAGYDPGPVDGFPGNKTKSAISQYQADNNLPIDGQPTNNLLTSLRRGHISNSKRRAQVSSRTVHRDQSESVETHSNQPAKHTPFGIPLGQRYSDSHVSKVIKKSQQGDGIEYVYVTPKKPHHFLNVYEITTFNGVIARVQGIHKVKDRKLVKEEEGICHEHSESIALALKKKYGGKINKRGRRTVGFRSKQGDMFVDFGAQCGSYTGKVYVRFIDFKVERALNQSFNEKKKKKLDDSVKKNDMF